MSMLTYVQPPGAALITSASLASARESWAECRRRMSGAAHSAVFFHDPCNPASDLVLQVLPALMERAGLQVELAVVGPPEAELAADPYRLARWGHTDSTALAAERGLDAPWTSEPVEPELAQAARAALAGGTIDDALKLRGAVWGGEPLPSRRGDADVAQVQRARLEGLGHYSSGNLLYGGTFYPGLDRLPFLERRLMGLGLCEGSVLDAPVYATPADAAEVRLWVSPRSPYSWVAMHLLHQRIRVDDQTLWWRGARVRLLPVLPMVMRGLPVPKTKARYLVHDAARVARVRGAPYGWIRDPLGLGVERVMAVCHTLDELDHTPFEFLYQAMKGAWSEGVDLATDSGLQRVAQRAGVSMSTVGRALAKPRWQSWADANQAELLRAGVWGVPSFQAAERVAWGQDKLERVEGWLLAD